MASSTARNGENRSGKQTYGGHGTQLFMGIIPSKYICLICTKVLRDAQLTICCGQHFCTSCLTKWLDAQEENMTCPHCRQEDFQHVQDMAMIREVNELKIHCTNHRVGCGWVGELGRLKSHLDSDKGCGHVKVTCTNEGCKEKMRRKYIQGHLDEKCFYRSYACKHCGYKDTYTAITGERGKYKFNGHYTECLEYPLACPNKCGVTSMRCRAMPDHRSSCSLEPLDCPFKDAGCTEKIARKDMGDHMTTNQQKHVLQGYQELKQDLMSFKINIRREIDSLEMSIQHKTNTPESTAQSLNLMKSVLQPSINKVGDKITFRVTDFPQLKQEKKMWQSNPFSVSDCVRVHLAVYPSGVGRGQGTHVSLSLNLVSVLVKEEHISLEHNVSITAKGQYKSATPKVVEVCTTRGGVMHRAAPLACLAWIPFPSPGEVLQSEELFLEVGEANSLLDNDSIILQLELREHQHHKRVITPHMQS